MPRDYCGHCAYLDFKNKRGNGTCYCRQKGWYVLPNSGCCSSFINDPVKSSTYKYFVTTAVVDTLGLGRDSKEYKTIQNLREETLEYDSYYDGVLDIYDIVGPVIATRIKEDNEFGLQNCEIALNNFIIPTCESYENGHVEGAVDIYTSMIDELMKVYGITLESAIEERKNLNEDMLNYLLNNNQTLKRI